MRQGIPSVECNAAVTMQYTFLIMVFEPRQNVMLKKL